MGSYEDAITAFANADALNPEDPMPDYLISRTYATRGEFGKAMQYAEQAVANKAADVNLRGNLGVMYYRNGYWTEAIVELGYVVDGGFTKNGEQINAMPLVPNNVRVAEYYFTYGLALARTNKCGDALVIARTILERIPSDELAVENANAIISKCEQNLAQTPEPLPTSPAPAPVLTETPTPTP
jgi:tetratricopeptide (TPR) repeat protein